MSALCPQYIMQVHNALFDKKAAKVPEEATTPVSQKILDILKNNLAARLPLTKKEEKKVKSLFSKRKLLSEKKASQAKFANGVWKFDTPTEAQVDQKRIEFQKKLDKDRDACSNYHLGT